MTKDQTNQQAAGEQALPPLPEPTGVVEIDCGPAPGGGREITFADGYSADQMHAYARAAQAAQPLPAPADGDAALAKVKDSLHLILGVCDAQDCPNLDKPTDFALAQSRNIRIGTIRRMAREAHAALSNSQPKVPQPLPVRDAWTVFGWVWVSNGRGVFVNTPENAEKLREQGHKVVEVYTRAALTQPAPEAAKRVPTGPVDLRALAEQSGISMDCWDMGAASMAYSEGCHGITRAHLEKFAGLVGFECWNMALESSPKAMRSLIDSALAATPPAPEAQQAEAVNVTIAVDAEEALHAVRRVLLATLTADAEPQQPAQAVPRELTDAELDALMPNVGNCYRVWVQPQVRQAMRAAIKAAQGGAA